MPALKTMNEPTNPNPATAASASPTPDPTPKRPADPAVAAILKAVVPVNTVLDPLVMGIYACEKIQDALNRKDIAEASLLLGHLAGGNMKYFSMLLIRLGLTPEQTGEAFELVSDIIADEAQKLRNQSNGTIPTPPPTT